MVLWFFLMNKRINKLPRKQISKGKVTGKIKNTVNLDVVCNPNDCITDPFTYYPTKFQFSDFYNKEIQGHDWIDKPRFLLEAKKGKYYTTDEKGVELAFRDLISYYYELDDPLQRLYDGYHDSMFVRFALKIGIFTTKHHWNMVLRSWEEALLKTIRVYYNYIHPKYDPSSNMPYTVFFDTHFSNRLYFEILDIEYRKKEVIQQNIEIVRLSQANKKAEYYV